MKLPKQVETIWQSFSTDDKSHKTKLHCAILMKRNKVLAIATNRVGSRSKGCGYSDRTIHAEKNVVKKLGDLSLLKGCTLYVSRISVHAHGSKPCEECTLFLRKCMIQWGLATVVYHEENIVPPQPKKKP